MKTPVVEGHSAVVEGHSAVVEGHSAVVKGRFVRRKGRFVGVPFLSYNKFYNKIFLLNMKLINQTRVEILL